MNNELTAEQMRRLWEASFYLLEEIRNNTKGKTK